MATSSVSLESLQSQSHGSMVSSDVELYPIALPLPKWVRHKSVSYHTITSNQIAPINSNFNLHIAFAGHILSRKYPTRQVHMHDQKVQADQNS